MLAVPLLPRLLNARSVAPARRYAHGVNLQPRLIPPPVWALDKARAATRAARERAGDGRPDPPRRPWWDHPPVSHPPATVDEVPRGRVATDPAPHGTRARYNHRPQPCRCLKCKAANARYQAAYRGRARAAVDEHQADAQPTLAR